MTMRVMLATALALLGLAKSGLAQEQSAIRQMIEMQLNSRMTEPRPSSVPGLEAGRLVQPTQGSTVPAMSQPQPGMGMSPSPVTSATRPTP